MGQFFLVLIVVCIVCGSLPLLASAYMRGELNIPENLVNALSFVGVALIALLQFPLNPSYDNLAIYFASLVIYIFVGQFLRKEHTRRKWCFCMLLVFLANCFGILMKCLVIQFGMVQKDYGFGLMDIGIFLVAAQIIVSMAYFLTPDKTVKNTKQAKKRK